MLTSDDGNELAFRVGDQAASLAGGDLVEFTEEPTNGSSQAVDVKLVKRWVEYLNDQHRPLVNEFHSIVEVIH